jgi:hypothetical protein
MPNALTKYASRKWIATSVVVCACIGLFTLNQLSEAGFVELLKWTLGLYFAANVGQNATEKTNA